jgi:hypothetical protein
MMSMMSMIFHLVYFERLFIHHLAKKARTRVRIRNAGGGSSTSSISPIRRPPQICRSLDREEGTPGTPLPIFATDWIFYRRSPFADDVDLPTTRLIITDARF